ncbi:hypothetical protein DFH06DRAFT_1318881 [Mycena polygramma]|nr:hypothetical protein DFH06DRAFT_1318881 [Mycena polygramma]
MPLSYSPALFSTVALRCRPLQKLRVDYGGSKDIDAESCTTLSAFIHQLSVVEDLDIPLPDYSSLKYVSRLNAPRCIRIPSLPFDIPLGIPLHSTTPLPSFVNLTELTIWHANFKAAVPVILMCTESAFERLTFCFRKGVPDEVASQFYSALARSRRSHASLRFLKVCADHDRPMRRTNFPIRSHMIQALFCFGNLTGIELESSYGFELNDSVCAQMACAWPQAERLTLREFYTPRHQLQLTFDAQIIPRLPRPEQLISQTTLEHLYVGYSPLKFITTSGEDAYKHREVDPDAEADEEFFAWRAVAELLPGRREMWKS